MLARRRRHLLRADRRPPQAQPRGGGLHLGAPLRSRAGARGVWRDRRRALRRRRARAAAARALPPADRGQPLARHARRGGDRRRGAAPGAAGGVRLPPHRRAAGVLVPARLGRRRPARATRSRSSRPASPTSRVRSTRPTRSPGCPGTRRARGSGRCSRRSSSAPARPSTRCRERRSGYARARSRRRMSAMWTSWRAVRAISSDSCRSSISPIPTHSSAATVSARADQVGVGHAVDVRLVGGVEREAEPAGHVRLAHPEQRRRHRDVVRGSAPAAAGA